VTVGGVGFGVADGAVTTDGFGAGFDIGAAAGTLTTGVVLRAVETARVDGRGVDAGMSHQTITAASAMARAPKINNAAGGRRRPAR